MPSLSLSGLKLPHAGASGALDPSGQLMVMSGFGSLGGPENRSSNFSFRDEAAQGGEHQQQLSSVHE